VVLHDQREILVNPPSTAALECRNPLVRGVSLAFFYVFRKSKGKTVVILTAATMLIVALFRLVFRDAPELERYMEVKAVADPLHM
jgi:hypothetical protein